MKNITITMDEATAQWARVEAARQGTSVSRMLGELLQQQRMQDTAYQNARQRYLKRDAVQLKSRNQRYPDRSQLHDR